MASVAPDPRKLRRRAEFTRVYEQGSRFRGRFMTCFVLANGLSGPRLGIAATAKMGNAVVRNRAKRRVRALFRTHKPGKAVDIVFVPRRELVDAPWPQLVADFVRIEKQLQTVVACSR